MARLEDGSARLPLGGLVARSVGSLIEEIGTWQQTGMFA